MMKLLGLLFGACLLTLLTECESFSPVAESRCGRAPGQRFFMATINDLPTRVALLEQGLETTNKMLTTLDTKIDNLSKDTKKMGERLDTKIDALGERLDTKIDALGERLDTKIDALGEKIDAKFEKLDKKLDEKLDKIAANQIAFSNSTTTMFYAGTIWLVVLTIIGGMLNIKDVIGWLNLNK
jgi:uncharacterized coiled-coil protein SlyX